MMAEIRFQIADDWIEGLRRKIGAAANADVARDALTLLNWAADEKLKGRVILSAEPSGKGMSRLAMPTLEQIKKVDSG
jgi:hypothetical protein